MPLTELAIENVRNIQNSKLCFDPKINFIYGDNGSGKTSLLESIYILGMARSFRTRLNKNIVTHEKKSSLIIGNISSPEHKNIRLAVEKKAHGKTVIKINHENNGSAINLINALPTQIINADSYFLINAGPSYRRKFIDWGVFHVEQTFYMAWKRYARALKQRNALLKNKNDGEELIAWNRELIDVGEQMDAMRKSFLSLFEPIFKETVGPFLGVADFTLDYSSGWDTQKTLSEALAASKTRDFITGSTQVGPHRANLEFRCKQTPVHEVLSRGQQKLFVCALFIAQNKCLKTVCNKNTAYLIDDIGSELDEHSISKLISSLLAQESQLFITCINPKEIEPLFALCPQKKMFHMEHGLVKEIS